MDTWEVSKVLFERVRALDPDNASRIVGMLLIQDNINKEMIRLAFGPEDLLHSFVAGVHAELAINPSSSRSLVFGSLQTEQSREISSPRAEYPPFSGEQIRYDGDDAFYPEEYDCWSWASGGHRQSISVTDAEAAAWRPCLYFAHGYCKNGASCRFLHGLPEVDAAMTKQEMAIVQRAKASAVQQPQLMEPTFPFPPLPRGLDFLLHQHQLQSEPQRASAMLLGGEEMHRYAVCSPQMDRCNLMTNPASRQIYLTFPADSTFSEEDVSNYFSMFGPVLDVRIPYQKRRMFGFVTFVYPESVKIVLSKRNPHFVCNARVLVKPYKEKGKVRDRFRKLQPPHHVEFTAGTTPIGLLDPRDPFDLQQPQIGPRMMFGDIANHEAFLRRKLEEQQQAIELQGYRFMGLQLLDLENRGHHLSSPVVSPMPLGQMDGKGNINGNFSDIHLEDVTIQDNKLNNRSFAMSAPASFVISTTVVEGKHEEKQKDKDGDRSPKQEINLGKEESGHGTAIPNVACGFQESGMDHNLPESLLASPTKASTDSTGATAQDGNISHYHMASSLLPPTSSLELPPYKSCLFPVPRFSRHEAIEP